MNVLLVPTCNVVLWNNVDVVPICKRLLPMNVLVLRFYDFLVRNCVHVLPMKEHVLPIYDFVHRNYDFVLPINDTLERNRLISRNLSENWLFLTSPKAKPPAFGV